LVFAESDGLFWNGPDDGMVCSMDTKPAPAEGKPEDRAAYLAAVDEGLADAEAKRTVPFEKVRRWLLSWGTDQELPPPKCP
jgi:hypothetical protein